MFQKFLIIVSKKDKAGMNIYNQISQFKENPLLSSMKQVPSFDIYVIEEENLFEKNLDIDKINKYDFIIFASKHSSGNSDKREKSLCVHIPGNWRSADKGGIREKVCLGSAVFQKQLFEKLKKNAENSSLNYEVTMEVTHHGPLIEKPCLFVEIGSTENEWTDRRAAFVVAKTISQSIKENKENPYNEIAIGIGGPHYCPVFNQIQLKSNVAISHIIPKYALPLTKEMILEAIDKTLEEVDFVILDWKGIGDKDQRKKIVEILNENHIQFKKTGEIKK